MAGVIRTVRDVLTGWGTVVTWCLILIMPRRARHRLIDQAIRAIPGFVYMSAFDQDMAIARYFWHR